MELLRIASAQCTIHRSWFQNALAIPACHFYVYKALIDLLLKFHYPKWHILVHAFQSVGDFGKYHSIQL